MRPLGGVFSSLLRGTGFAQGATLLEALALFPPLAPVAHLQAVLVTFVATWMAASPAQQLRGRALRDSPYRGPDCAYPPERQPQAAGLRRRLHTLRILQREWRRLPLADPGDRTCQGCLGNRLQADAIALCGVGMHPRHHVARSFPSPRRS